MPGPDAAAAERRRLEPLLVVVAPCLVFAWGAWSRRWIADDGLINVRVVDQLLAGEGPSYSPLVRAEVATSPVWIGLLAVAALATPFRTDAIAVGLGGLLSVAGLALGTVAAWRAARAVGVDGPRTLLPLGVLAYALAPHAWDFATSGLELGLVLVWLGGCALVIEALSAGRPLTVPQAVLFGLGPLLRPDLALMSAVFLGAPLLAAPREERRRRLAVAAAGLVVPALATLARAGYYGVLVPNAGLAKEGLRPRFGQGLRYLGESLTQHLTIVAVAVVVLAWLRASRPARSTSFASVLAVAGGLHIAYIVLIGGDFMVGRLLLPGGFALACATGVAAVTRQELALQALAVGLLVVVAVVGRWDDEPLGYDRSARVITGRVVDERDLYAFLLGTRHPTSAEDHDASPFAIDVREALRDAPPESLTIVPTGDEPAITLPLAPEVAARHRRIVVTPVLGIMATDIGVGVAVLDPVGLADPLASHARLEERGRPGHEKRLPDEWYVAWLAEGDAELPATVDADRVAAARRALDCGALADLLAATTEPMTLGRWLDNMVAAPRLTTFRFDSDPLVAERELCGDG